ncbi:hypothetical protein Tco_0720183 [Tanacetum coccineum]
MVSLPEVGVTIQDRKHLSCDTDGNKGHDAPANNVIALIDVYKGEITLRLVVGKEAITFKPGPNFKITVCLRDIMRKTKSVIDMACDEYLKRILGFSNVDASVNPLHILSTIVSTASLNLLTFGAMTFFNGRSRLFLALED